MSSTLLAGSLQFVPAFNLRLLPGKRVTVNNALLNYLDMVYKLQPSDCASALLSVMIPPLQAP